MDEAAVEPRLEGSDARGQRGRRWAEHTKTQFSGFQLTPVLSRQCTRRGQGTGHYEDCSHLALFSTGCSGLRTPILAPFSACCALATFALVL